VDASSCTSSISRDADELVERIKTRYERPIMEVFG
jgi:hypothetical protein